MEMYSMGDIKHLEFGVGLASYISVLIHCTNSYNISRQSSVVLSSVTFCLVFGACQLQIVAPMRYVHL